LKKFKALVSSKIGREDRYYIVLFFEMALLAALDDSAFEAYGWG
jgi:hypothetical protein